MLLLALAVAAVEHQKLNFNAGWRLEVGDFADTVC